MPVHALRDLLELAPRSARRMGAKPPWQTGPSESPPIVRFLLNEYEALNSSALAQTNFPKLSLALAVGGTPHSIKAIGEQNVMSDKWYTRPVLFVADIDSSIDFYVKQLGFTQAWRFEEDGKAYVAQVSRHGCELILSSQWPDKVGNGLMFISLDPAVLDALRAELEGRGVDVKDGQWGYRLMVVADPDGNQLYFPYPASPATGSPAASNPAH